MIDLREEMNKMINEFGYNLLIQRHSEIFKCRCVNEKEESLYNETKNPCTVCNGSGKIIKLERHKGIAEEYDIDMSVRESIGDVSVSSMQFFFEHNILLNTGDIIYEVGWRDNYPITLHNIFEIKYKESPRGDLGRKEYTSYIAINKNINLKNKEKNMIRNIKAFKNDFLLGEI